MGDIWLTQKSGAKDRLPPISATQLSRTEWLFMPHSRHCVEPVPEP
jgi:hypothetical protein